MRLTSYKIVATLIALSFAANAAAEDGYGYGSQVQPQAQVAAQAQAADNNYAVPPSYQGQYYPQETESAIGYHATTNTSSNAPAAGDEGYYYYYY